MLTWQITEPTHRAGQCPNAASAAASGSPAAPRAARPPNDPAPPFAEYASGHSTFSAAAAEVLTAFTGRGNFEYKVTIAAGSSKVEPGAVPAKPITLSWTNFRYAAEQAGLSRQYGGLHFEHGDKDARAVGANVGQNAWAKAVTYINGTAR